jgi:hypothetical protein
MTFPLVISCALIKERAFCTFLVYSFFNIAFLPELIFINVL